VLAKCFFFLISLLVVTSTNAATIEDLQQKLNNIKTYRATFSQTVKDDTGQTIQQSEGDMALAKPMRFRWETFKPVKQLIVLDGKRVWIYDIDLEQVSVRPLALENQSSPAFFLSSKHKIAEQYQLKSYKNQRFILTPRNKQAKFQRIVLQFAGEALSEMQMVDPLGQTTTLTLKSTHINQKLSPKLFQFKAPAGVDVITTQDS